ncbi:MULTISPECIES: glycosyltransferase family 4 protein [unclassified Brevundimonas]|uniref:glycosyltransferase family 4 protein n=1 Tax=unclassified Brevundimonas TaxID=2622653 RepID=UPI0006F3D81C|nr:MULTISPECIES: glycosyltransferase family 4 protein [unclassified Brevundimonas]KQY90136.1 glycosyl transferase [Brevundimonas sp. Root1423]KRA22927.1 glycosyl transferase [Brevundimonas sp. Root608]
MKIAQVTPLYEAVPPKLYGGTERVVAHLTDALVDLGHDVTLFASADAETRARLIPVRDQAIRLDPAPLKSDLAAHMTMLAEVLKRADDFDVIHFHTDMIHFPFFSRCADKTITTLHGRLDLKDLAGVYERWNEFGLVSISDDQRRPLPLANWKATVHHGMPGETYKFSPKAQGYLAFLGRISPEKRPDRAIEIAVKLNKPLRIAAKVDAADKVYWETVIKPMVDANPLVEFVGEIGDHQKSAFLGGAEALLFPIDWPEPFGLVMIEAMACGTPVVAFRCGSTPEIIEDGETGFLVDTLEQAVAAAGRAHLLDREAIRARFDLRFSATAMARRYLDVYGDLLARRPYAEEPLAEVVTPLRAHEGRSFFSA